MHSFGLTERYLVLAEFPFVVNPLALALSGRPYIENYRWKPELGTRFTLVDRETGQATGGFETDACFAFHHVNAYEDGDEVVVDLCTYARRRRDRGPLPRAPARRQAGGIGDADALPSFSSPTDRCAASSWPSKASSCRASTTGAATSARTATSGATATARTGGSSRSSRST